MRPGPNIAVRVEFMARQVPSQAGNETSEDNETHCYLSVAIFLEQERRINNAVHSVSILYNWTRLPRTDRACMDFLISLAARPNHAGIVGEIEGQLLLAFSNIRDSQDVTFSFQHPKHISAQT